MSRRPKPSRRSRRRRGRRRAGGQPASLVNHRDNLRRATGGDDAPLAQRSVAAQIPMTMRPLITLLTDFGTADGYVAEMKGVLYSLLADAIIVDLSHDI
ncbi:MAG: SAM-dependent chlorinase/fluorinase, partial [Gemmatimonadaceae bacterium]